MSKSSETTSLKARRDERNVRKRVAHITHCKRVALDFCAWIGIAFASQEMGAACASGLGGGKGDNKRRISR